MLAQASRADVLKVAFISLLAPILSIVAGADRLSLQFGMEETNVVWHWEQVLWK